MAKQFFVIDFACLVVDGDTITTFTDPGPLSQDAVITRLQRAIDSDIVVPIPLGQRRLVAFVDEDGLPRQRPANLAATRMLALLGARPEVYVGPIAFAGRDRTRFTGLSADEIADLTGLHTMTTITAARTAPAIPAGAVTAAVTVGQRVHVWATGTWREGTVTTIARTRATVRFLRTSGGEQAERRFPLTDIHSADGLRLMPVDQLRPGHVVVLNDGEHTLTTIAPDGQRTRRLTFTTRDDATVNAGSVLRVHAT